MLLFNNLLRPTSLEEAYQMAIKHKFAPLLAGTCWTRLGRRIHPFAIDLSGLGLDYIRQEGSEIVIGAMATQAAVEKDPSLQALCGGVLPKAVHEILGVQFRNMATMGGSVAAKFGFSDIIPTLLALHADVILVQGGRMTLEEYVNNYKARDILVEIRIPHQEVPIAIEALRISRGDFPLLTGAVARHGHNYEVYIGTRPGPAVLATKASALLTQEGAEAAKKAGDLVAEELVFQSNSHASGQYRASMASNMVQRLVKEVAQWK